ncbi:MAG TPA: ABC transporter permease [Bryobacteraceae bacterium]|jgi:putative ABC transport system permease protein|nr:ABC transporter permease [Bryobacteraceae bacterium]
MSLLSRLASLRLNIFARPRVERELDDELGAYLDQLVEEKRDAGMGADEARRAARIELGGLEQVKEEVRQVRTGRMFNEFLRDLHYAARMLRKNPAFTAVAVLALALGIGANTAMFSVAYGILLRPLPYANADRVAIVYMRYFPRDFAFGTLSIRDYLIWKENNHAFEDPSLFRVLTMDIGGTGRVPEQVRGASVTADFFSTLGVRPLIGRTFASGDDKPGAGALAVLSESIWRQRFAATPAILGQVILVNGAPSTVIGVMPDVFRFPQRQTEVWNNLRLDPPTRFGPWFYRGVARLKPGVTLRQAQAETNSIGQLMMQQNSFYKRLTLPVLSLREALMGTALKPALLVLAGAVGFVLLIAVVNVANLMLARATVREREMALRLSLGAGRRRLVRQLLTESMLLSGLGGLAGLALAWGSITLIRFWNPGNLPLIDSVRLDGGALGFMVFISMLTGVLFGLAPALTCANTDLNATIKEGGRTGASSRTHGRARAALVVSEIAISLMLLVGAGLLLRSFVNLQSVNGGFSTPPRQILTMLISPGNRKYNDPRVGLAFYDEVLRRARNVPGVTAAAVTDSLPPDRQGDADTFGIEGQSLAPGDINPIVSDGTAGPNFFQALGIPLIEGRYFTSHDGPDSAPVAIVSEGFVRRFFRNQDAIGKRIRQSGPGFGNKWLEIVGVVGNVKYLGLTVDTDPAYYMPFAQSYGQRMFLVVRTSSDAASMAAELRRNIQSIDPGVTLAQIGTMEQALALSVSQPRFDTMLLALFAAIALLLAAVGIYGLVAYSVAQRTHEIGVRMALGAAQSDVLRLVLRQSASLAAIGVLLGLCGAFALTRLLKTMLFGVGVTDALTYAAAPLAIVLVVLLATFLPALRAIRISPVSALRYE